MIFTAAFIDKMTTLHSSITLSDDLGYVGELEGANHPVPHNNPVAGFP
jgi:hypothetical protein